jgi:hypothetical protein
MKLKITSASFVLTLMILVSGCATFSNRNNTLISMVGAGLVAGIVAAQSAPERESKILHGVLWGGGAAAFTGAVGLFYFDEEKRSTEAERKLGMAQKELDAFRGESDVATTQSELERSSALERELPSEYRALVKPGKWSVYKINQWVVQGENALVHQDRLLRLEPPQFQPSGNTNKQGDVE